MEDASTSPVDDEEPDAVVPVDPVEPVDPVLPVDPVDPVEPVDPVLPVEPPPSPGCTTIGTEQFVPLSLTSIEYLPLRPRGIVITSEAIPLASAMSLASVTLCLFTVIVMTI